MNSYGPIIDTLHPINHNHTKKYSLRRRCQNQRPEQLDRSRNGRKQSGSFLQGGRTEQGGWWTGEELLQDLNCMQSAQRILDFNQVPSLNYKNHSKTLSTTPSSFENPFAPHPYTTHTLQRTTNKKSLACSRQELNPSHAKSHKSSVSHKLSYHSSKLPGERLQTQNNSQPVSTVNCYGLYENGSEGERRGKISLKDRQKFSGQTKSELLICLKYSDLKYPITDKPFSQTLMPHRSPPPELGLARYLCTTAKSHAGGCSCQPKCHWMDRWLANTPEGDTSAHGQPSSLEWEGTLKQIERDLPRTQPESSTFREGEHLGWVREVLVGYARMDWEVGYVQGMNFIAAALVYHSRSSQEALRVMQRVMRGCGFRKILLKDMALSHLVSKRCLYQLKRVAYDLYTHLIREEVQVQVFITSWYFSLLGSFVPLSSMHLIIDKFLRSQFTGINEIIITLLIYLKGTLLALRDHTLMLAFSGNQMSAAAGKIDWEELVIRSDHLLLDPLPY